MEHNELTKALHEFSRQGMESAREKNAPKDAIALFETGLALLDSTTRSTISPKAKIETERVENASGTDTSLFGKILDYSDFFIRGKYERDTLMQDIPRNKMVSGIFPGSG